MACGMWSIALLSFVIASLTLQATLKNGFIDFSTTSFLPVEKTPTKLYLAPPPPNTYTCHYAGMWCTCFANNNGGCSVGCSPNVYKTLFNQTSCPQLSSFILAGFNLV